MNEAQVLNACLGVRWGRQAYFTWRLIQVVGRAKARCLVPPATWYRHLEVLRGVGLDVPAVEASGSHWLGAATVSEAMRLLSQNPGRIMQLVGQRFAVRGFIEGWPLGTEGQVKALVFNKAWFVTVERDDERHDWDDIDARVFLSNAIPLGGSHAH